MKCASTYTKLNIGGENKTRCSNGEICDDKSVLLILCFIIIVHLISPEEYIILDNVSNFNSVSHAKMKFR